MNAALKFVLNQPWAMLPEMVDVLVSIAERTNDAPEMVAAKLGRPLDNTRTVEMHDGGVAVIPIRGPISRYASMFDDISGATSVEILARDFRAALDDPAVSGIVLEIDSPGGQAAGIGELAAMIRAGSKVKPVTSYVSSMGASAALWLATAPQGMGVLPAVVCSPQAIMGSMGVVWPVSVPKKDKDGPRTIEFVSSVSPNKRPDVESDAGKAQMQAIVDSMAAVFVESVAGYRKLDPKDAVKQFNRGGVLVGKACVDAGMADRLGSLESCIADMARKSTGKSAKPVKSHSKPVYMDEKPMKFNMTNLITGWLGKGKPEVMDSADLASASVETGETETETEGTENVATSLGELTVDLTADTKTIDAAVAKAREQFKAEMSAELRKGRISLYGDQASAYLSLLGGKITPAELPKLKSAYVAASLIDAENPIEGYSALEGFKACLDARTSHGATVENVTGTAGEIANHLSANGLKVLGNQVNDPEEARRAAEKASRDAILGATDMGRAILAEEAAKGK